MRQILFQISLDQPWDLGPQGKIPGFGFGLVLAVWALFGIGLAIYHVRKGTLRFSNALAPLVEWLFVAALIVYGAPALGRYLRIHGTDAWRNGIPIFGYGLMMFIGVMAATWFAARRANSVGLPNEFVWDLAVWLFIPGIVGARLFYLVQYGHEVFGDAPVMEWPYLALNLSQGGIVLYGALLGGAAGYFSFCFYHRIRPLGLADIVVPSVFIGIGFGRIGCFLNGCCYGCESTLPWAVQFPKSSSAFASLVEKHLIDTTAVCTPPLHPTQIYSSIDGFMIAFITSWYFWHRRRNGEVLALALIIYPVTRFCMELLRGDEVGKFGTALTISQWISIGLFLINIPYMIFLSKRPAVLEPIAVPRETVDQPSNTVATARR